MKGWPGGSETENELMSCCKADFTVSREHFAVELLIAINPVKLVTLINSPHFCGRSKTSCCDTVTRASEQVADSCEFGNEPLDLVTFGEILD